MAYTIIGQNNTTTTVDDGNGHTLHIPSRVALAIGTTFTITEVNNNMATLEDSNGKVYRDIPCVVNLVDAGGGDSHNLGWYATSSDLTTAHPTASAGDWAIVGATDTVWVWDTDTTAWVDTDTKGQVTSVNNQTGAVTIGANDILPSQTGYSGRVLGTDGFVAGWVEPEIVQRSTIPQASADELGNIYQFIGTTDSNYTNGYFYKCVSDGQEPATYSWTQVSVQPAPSGLPSQTGNSGKFLTTDGTDASWSDKPLVNTATGTNGIGIGGASLVASGNNSIAVGPNPQATATATIAIGLDARATVADGIAIGDYARSGGNKAYQLGAGTNNTANSFQVGSYQLLKLTDGTIPHARLTNAVSSTTVSIAAADWNGGTTVSKTVSGLTATSVVWVAPDHASQSDYTSAGVYASSQTTDTLEFSCTTTPTSALTVTVVFC